MTVTTGLPNEGSATDGATTQGEAGRDTTALSPRDGADSHDVGRDASEVLPADEKGGAAESCGRPAPDPAIRKKALACLREGRVSVLGVKLDAGWRPVRVVGRVRSSRDAHPYRVQLRAGQWSCNCRDGLRNQPCAHSAAVALVTTGGANG